MTSLYVREAHHEVLPARDLRLEPRARFVEYQEDLHRISGASLDRASLTRGDQYTFTHLADTLLERTGAETLSGLDVFAVSYWTPEFDPDISAFGPYLHHRYSLTCRSFDVVDHGSISPLLGLLVLVTYLRVDPEAGEAVLLAVEQSTVPEPVGAHFPGPGRSSAGLARLSRYPGGTEVLEVRSIGATQVLDPAFDLAAVIEPWQQEFSATDLTIAIRRGSFLYRKWNHQLAEEWPVAVDFRPPEPSCTEVFRWLAQLTPAEEPRFVALIEEDVESLSAVTVLVKVGTT